MKTIFTVIFLTIFSTFSQAQYQSLFGLEHTSWDMAVGAPGIFQLFPSLDSCYVGIDTIINGKVYREILWKHFYHGVNDHARGFLREDTLTGRAWYMSVYSGEEQLLMDLSLEVGDTFSIRFNESIWTPAVDSVYYYNDKKYIRFNGQDSADPFTFIEGVGTTYGLTYRDPAFELGLMSYYTLCQTKDGDTLSYVNNSPYFLGRCDVSAVGVDERQKPAYNLHIFPNPANEKIVIEGVNDLVLDKNEGLVLTVSDVTGRLVHHEKVAFFPCELEIAEWPKGLYIITVGNIAIGKFLKN